MTNVKISQLPAGTTPLSGTEPVPIVQGGVTKQVPASAISSGTLTLTIGGTSITLGTANRLLFDNAGTLGELILGTNLSISGGNTLNAASGSSGITINTTTITGGTPNRLLFDHTGTIGELILGTNLSISGGNTLNSANPTITINTTPIVSGTSGRILYDNASEVGELVLGTNLSISSGTLNATANLTVGSTTIASGATNRLLFDNAGVLGELILGTNLAIAGGNTLNATGGSGTTTIQTLDIDTVPSYTTTLANVVGIANSLSLTITNANSYYFKIVLQMFAPDANSGGSLTPVANGGIKVAFGGTGSVTYLSAAGSGMDDTTPFVVETLNYAGASIVIPNTPLITYMGSGSSPYAVISGVLTCSGTGTFTVQFAQAASNNALACGVRQGSFIEQVPITISSNTGTSLNRWAPEFTGPNLTLSNNNLTVTRSASGGTDTGQLSQNFHTSGKFYCEFTFTVGSVANGNQRFGFGTALKQLTRDMGIDNEAIVVTLGGTTLSAFWLGQNIATYSGYSAFGNATVFQLAVDVGAQLVWFNAGNGNWNGSAAAHPNTGAGGLSFAPSSGNGVVGPVTPAIELLDANSVCVAVFDTTATTFTPPAGFGNW